MHGSRMLLLSLLVGGTLSIGLFCGCEDDADMENVSTQFDDSSSTASSSGTTSALMAISPSATSLTNNGAVVSFTVSGASGTATWSVQDISKGSILTQSTRTATYQRSAAGDNVVIATAGGTAAFATVRQP
jgi:hypothetical protein